MLDAVFVVFTVVLVAITDADFGWALFSTAGFVGVAVGDGFVGVAVGDGAVGVAVGDGAVVEPVFAKAGFGASDEVESVDDAV